MELQQQQLREQTERTDAVTRLVARVNVATYVICKTQPDLKVFDYYQRAMYSGEPKVYSGNLLPNNQRQRRTCYALCHIMYPVAAALEMNSPPGPWSRC